jgi:acetylglutamate kinase
MQEITPKPHPRASRLKGRKVVVKFGGSSIGGEGAVQDFAKDIALLASIGIHPIVVHGGGPEISQEMSKRGLKVSKVAGLRVTDDATLQVAAEVLEHINEQLVDALRQAGMRAVGMSGVEDRLLVCMKMHPAVVKDDQGNQMLVDLGHVGEVIEANTTKLDRLVKEGNVPVIYPICASAEGDRMNVNADTAAAHIAKAVKAEEFVLVTDVPGILRDFKDPQSLIREVSLEQLDELIREGVVRDGMIPKVEACRLAVEGGVKAAHMVSGKEKDAIVNQLLSGDNVGTRITK